MRRLLPARPFVPALTAGALLGAALMLVSAPPAVALCSNPPLQATLKFQNPPANATFALGAAVKLVLQIENCSGAEVLTTDGFSSTDFYRFLSFAGPKGGVINTGGAPLHVVGRTFFCLSRQGVLQSPSIPVVPVEKLSAPPSKFFREYLIDAATFFDLSVPGLYTVTEQFELLTFDISDSSAVFDDCDQFQGPPKVSLVNVAAVTGRHSFTVVSNTLQFVVSAAGVLDHITISPATSSIASGGTEFYTAQGFDASNNSLGDVTATTTFKVDGSICSGTGCTATTGGDHTVTGTNTGAVVKTATATLTVAPVGNVVKVWVGLATSDDVGIRFDLRAVVTKNGGQVVSGQLGSVAGGSSGFNNAKLSAIPLPSFSGTDAINTLSLQVFVRNACSKSGKQVGTAELWFNGAKIDTGTARDAGSRLSPPGETASSTLYFLKNLFKLNTLAGSARIFIGKQVGSPCGQYQSFGIWSYP